jgi:uncharacterized protein (UPF0276 family)
MVAATDAIGVGWRHPHYAEVLASKPALGFLEVHSENFFADGGAPLSILLRGRAQYPVSLHGVGLSLGSAAGIDPWHLEQLARLVDRIDPIRISDHASFARAKLPGGVVHASDLLPIPFSVEALNVLCTNVQTVQDRLKRPLMVENLSAYVQWKLPEHESLTEADFLNQLARRTGCGLLVDVNNIYVNALNALPQSEQELALAHCCTWLDSIDTASVGELHLAGHRRVNDEHGDIVIDDHGSQVCAPVWQLYEHALKRFGCVPTLIEWDTDIPALDVLMAEVAMARGHQAALQAHSNLTRVFEADTPEVAV